MRLLSLVIVLSIAAVVVLATPTPSPLPSPLPSPSPSPMPSLKGAVKWVLRKLKLRRHRRPQPQPPNTYDTGEFVNVEDEQRAGDPILRALFAIIEEGNGVEGIYRLSASDTELNTAFNDLRNQMPAIRTGAAPVIPPNMDHLLAACLVKLYLRSATDHLFTLENGRALNEQTPKAVADVMETVPMEKVIMLEQIIYHLRTMVGKVAITKMNSENLATVIAPNLFDGEAFETLTFNHSIQYLIDHQEVFPELNQ
jgi:hypothetical protein